MSSNSLFFLVPALLLSFCSIAQDTLPDDYYVRYVYDTTIITNANVKQELYCDEEVEWAGYIDIDIIPNQKKNQSWDNFQASGFSNLNFKQYTADTIPTDTSLLDYIIANIKNRTLPIYQTPQLEQLLEIANSDLIVANYNEDVIQYRNANDFEILRLRCIVFYDKNGAEILLYPMAAAPIRTEYDIYSPTAKAFYIPLGWIPITGAAPSNISWQKMIHSDVNTKKIKVFKQGFTQDEVLTHLIQSHQSNEETSPLFDATNLDHPTLLSKEQLTKRITFEHLDFDPETYEEIITRAPIEHLGLVGFNFSIDWAWDENETQLHAEVKGISPIIHNMDLFCDNCPDENMFLSRLFLLKPYEKK